MLEEKEKQLDGKLKDLIEEGFGPLNNMTAEYKRQVFFLMYKVLALIMESDFDMITELQIVSITQDKSKEIKDVLPHAENPKTA